MSTVKTLLNWTLLIAISCCNSTTTNSSYSSMVSEDVVSNLIVEILKQERESLNQELVVLSDNFNYNLSEHDSTAIRKLDTILTKSDMDFIFNQYEARNTFSLPSPLTDIAILSKDPLYLAENKIDWKAFRTKYKTAGIYFISVPLFSLDKKTAIIDISFYCGKVCGFGRLAIFKKRNNKWTLVHSISEYQS